MTSPTVTACPRCAAPASGQFCASCGAPLGNTTCSVCSTALSQGARFCHRCGTPAGERLVAPPPRGLAEIIPWMFASIALVALIALVAGQRFSAPSASTLDAPSNALPQAGLDFDRPGPAAPDISQMSPRELWTRLYDRIMTVYSAGKLDSAQFLAWNMAIPAFQMLEAPDADARYELGRVGEVIGAPDIASAQADTILRQNASHLLGLVLAARAARMSGRDSAARAFDRRLISAEPAEMAKPLEEYQAHRADITQGLADARKPPQ